MSRKTMASRGKVFGILKISFVCVLSYYRAEKGKNLWSYMARGGYGNISPLLAKQASIYHNETSKSTPVINRRSSHEKMPIMVKTNCAISTHGTGVLLAVANYSSLAPV